MSERWRDRAVVVASAVLAAVVLGPALGPGYALVGDPVFVPDQVLLPWMAGLGGGLPRAVPQDAVLAVLTGPVPGWVWHKNSRPAIPHWCRAMSSKAMCPWPTSCAF